jgi:hypothetical protein
VTACDREDPIGRLATDKTEADLVYELETADPRMLAAAIVRLSPDRSQLVQDIAEYCANLDAFGEAGARHNFNGDRYCVICGYRDDHATHYSADGAL